MAHITEFYVEGLAGRSKPYRQKLNRDINIFFGLNGSGKTSLLRILHSAMSGNASILQPVPFKKARVAIYSINYNQIFTWSVHKPLEKAIPKKTSKGKAFLRGPSGKIYFVDEQSDVDYKTTLKWTTKEKEQLENRPYSWSHSYLPIWRYYGSDPDVPATPFRKTTGKEVSELEYQWDSFFAKKLTEIWSSYNNQILSNVSNIQARGLASILKSALIESDDGKKEKIREFDSKTAYNKLAGFLARHSIKDALGDESLFQQRYQGDQRLKKVVDDINVVESDIEEAMKTRNDLQRLLDKMYTGKTVALKDYWHRSSIGQWRKTAARHLIIW